MRIEVVGKGIEITPAILQHAETKASKLPRYFDGVQLITLRLQREDHHNTGHFGVELIVDVIKHPEFVATAEGEDLYLVIDQVVQKAARQLTDFKERLKMEKR